MQNNHSHHQEHYTVSFTQWYFLLFILTFFPNHHHIAANETKHSKSNLNLNDKLPNIIILLADNLGYNDISSFGAPSAQTPNIDTLSTDGLKLNNWNSAASLCSASRASLLTGKYPVRSGIYPAVFKPDAVNGMLPSETTLAEFLRNKNYATSIVGKWHLGQRKGYLPTHQGFDEWFGLPYHMSGGSISEDHVCVFDKNENMWLPLFDGVDIVEQPVDLRNLAVRYVDRAVDFMRRTVLGESEGGGPRPFFLYVPFSHVHQLCAPQQHSCQWASQQFSPNSPHATFVQGVEEMDWIAGEILREVDALNVTDDTLVLFTSDNGPWVAEQSCAGSKGPFEGRWLRDYLMDADEDCTACPLDYVPSPTLDRPRRCVFPGKEREYQIDGIPCGEDTGLGSVWEANLRMPAIARWPGRIPAGEETMAMVSTLDVVPTVLSLLGMDIPEEIDGEDVSEILLQGSSYGKEREKDEADRVLFFWRDGFKDGPLPPPFGRFDVAAAKLGDIKAWFYTKSAHYNSDVEVHHDPPLLFNIIEDPAEAFPLDPNNYKETIAHILDLVKQHKSSIDWTYPLALARDPRYIPCANAKNQCRTNVDDNKSLGITHSESYL